MVVGDGALATNRPSAKEGAAKTGVILPKGVVRANLDAGSSVSDRLVPLSSPFCRLPG